MYLPSAKNGTWNASGMNFSSDCFVKLHKSNRQFTNAFGCMLGVQLVMSHFRLGILKRMACCFAKLIIGHDMEKHASIVHR